MKMFSSGHIFVCTKKTEKECFSRALFGGPMSMWKEISKINNETAIFLFKKTKRNPILYGVFLADSMPGCDIERDAWEGKYPAQVRVRQYYEFCNLPLRTFQSIFEENKMGKTAIPITAEQTVNLIIKFIMNTRMYLGHCVMRTLSGKVIYYF